MQSTGWQKGQQSVRGGRHASKTRFHASHGPLQHEALLSTARKRSWLKAKAMGLDYLRCVWPQTRQITWRCLLKTCEECSWRHSLHVHVLTGIWHITIEINLKIKIYYGSVPWLADRAAYQRSNQRPKVCLHKTNAEHFQGAHCQISRICHKNAA